LRDKERNSKQRDEEKKREIKEQKTETGEKR
jgi:hypothetical protein